jgi:hypothetical protein
MVCAITLLVGSAGTGCDTTAPCVTEEKILEVSNGLRYDYDMAVLRAHLDQGWMCHPWGTFPGGTRYRCTICI